METLFVVTGATSHFGQAMIRDLINHNKKIRVLIHKTALPTSIRDYPIEIVNGSILDLDSLRALLSYEGEIVLIHAANCFEFGEEISESMQQVNIQGTQNIIDICYEKKVSKLIYLSSSEIIRKPKTVQRITETQYFRVEGLKSGFNKSKAVATQMVLDAGKTGLPVYVFLPSVLIGPYDFRGGLAGRLITDFLENKIKFLIKGGLDLVDVRDVSKAVLTAIEISRPQEVYLVTGEYVSLSDFLGEVARCTRRKRIKAVLPDFMRGSLETINRVNTFIHRRDFNYSPQLVDTLNSSARYSSNKAIRYLGYEVRPLTDSIIDTIQFFVDTEQIDSQISLRKKGKIIS